MITLGISSEDFWQLTPAQLSVAFEIKRIQEEEKVHFQAYQTRLINFYSMVAMSGTKHVDSPEKLYKLPFDKHDLTEEQRNILLSPISDDDLKFIKKLTISN